MAKKKMTQLGMASWIACTVAALHLGLVGGFNFNLFDTLLGAGSMVTKTLYIVIGLLAVYSLWCMSQCKK